jgi:hypothetical protein
VHSLSSNTRDCHLIRKTRSRRNTASCFKCPLNSRAQYFNSDEFHNNPNDQQRDLLRSMSELYPGSGSRSAYSQWALVNSGVVKLL